MPGAALNWLEFWDALQRNHAFPSAGIALFIVGGTFRWFELISRFLGRTPRNPDPFACLPADYSITFLESKPEAPSGCGGATVAVCTSPFPSVARTVKVCLPVLWGQSYRQITHVAADSG